MDIQISFALQCYVYVIDFIPHVTLNIIIWWIPNKRSGMKKLWFKLHFNQKKKTIFYKNIMF